MGKKLLVCAALCGSVGFAAGLENPRANSIYVEPAGGFEMNVSAAIQKKAVAATVVTDESEAHYILRCSPIQIHQESGMSKIARCAFVYCWGIDDSGDVSVQLVEKDSHRVVWAYEVAKQRAQKNRQSMAEAIAKHMQKEFFGQGW